MTSVQKLSHTSFNHNLIGFVPALVIEYLLEKLKRNDPWKLPEKQSFKSVVMFADISGFTNLSEKLSKKGSEGAELLAFTLNRYMELLVTAISRSGGDIFKFAGDAMIVLWPPPHDEKDEELTTLARQAIQSAIDIQARLHDMKLVEDIKLSVKIGFGIGQVTIIHVGGVYNRAEYLATGDPLTQAFECEHMATTGGVVIIPNEIFKRVRDYFTFESLESSQDHHHSANGPFQKVTGVIKGKAVKMKADALLIKNKLKPSDIENIRKNLTSYIPAAVIPFIEIDQEKWSSELRHLTILFVNLGIDLTDAKDSTGKGLERIQEVIKTVQTCVYAQFGSLNKLLMDDKGSTLIVVFGLPPMAHQDDPVRGVITGMKLVSELKKINCACSVGVTTGCVFAGVVGTSGNRREYSILGDSVNLSARFMQAACKEKDKKVLVDEETKKEAENRISFEFVMKQPVKGKTGEINFYEPIQMVDDGKDRFPDIRTHISIANKEQGIFEITGKDREKIMNDIKAKFTNFFKRLDENVSIFITGSYGIGKSFFIRKIIEIIYNNRDDYTWKYDKAYPILVSNLNCDTKKPILNGWRKVAKDVLGLLALRRKVSPETAIGQVLEKRTDLEGFIYTVEDVLGLRLPSSKSGPELVFRGSNKILDPKNGKAIVKIICALIQDFLEESEKKASEDSSNDLHVSGRGKRDASTHIKQDCPPPLVVVLDDMEDHDELSWKTTKRILKTCKKIIVLGAMRSEDNEQPLQSNKADGKSEENRTQEVINDEGMQAIEEACSERPGFLKVELEGLMIEDMSQFLMKFYKFNNFSFESIDKEHNLKVEELKIKQKGPPKKGSSAKEIEIERKDQETRIQNDIMEKNLTKSKIFMTTFTEKTQGNPLTGIHLFQKLLDGGFISLENKKVSVKESLEKMIELDELLTIDAPLSRAKINGQLIDRLTCEQHLIMKTASVIGECFDLQTLLKVNPFKLSITSEKVRKILSELENMDYIEILDEQEHNITYRLTHIFLREVLYQRMIFNQRRQIHRFFCDFYEQYR